jgi:hypothetical protein
MWTKISNVCESKVETFQKLVRENGFEESKPRNWYLLISFNCEYEKDWEMVIQEDRRENAKEEGLVFTLRIFTKPYGAS